MPLHLRHGFAAAICVAFTISWTSPTADGADPERRILKLSPRDDLPKAVLSARPGTTILLADGIYRLKGPLPFLKPDVRLRSASGDRDKVILDGHKEAGKPKRENCLTDVIVVRASDVTLADLSVRHAGCHGIHISPQPSGNIRNIVMRNIHVYDCGQHLIKANSSGGDTPRWVDDCILEDSLIEFKDNSIMAHGGGDNFYTGGLNVHGGRNWRVRRNVFRKIERDGRMMEHAVLFWKRSRGTVVERNRFVDCYRAIGFGIETRLGGCWVRAYPDGKGQRSYLDHLEGTIRNNAVFNRKGIHLESGIELWNVTDVKVCHNTVVSHDPPFSSIEYRYPNTRVEIANNIVSHRILAREGGKAMLKQNIQKAAVGLFKDLAAGDLHLTPEAFEAIDRGVPGKDTDVSVDIDGHLRDAHPDIGADER